MAFIFLKHNYTQSITQTYKHYKKRKMEEPNVKISVIVSKGNKELQSSRESENGLILSRIAQLQVHAVEVHPPFGEDYDTSDTERKYQEAVEERLLQSSGMRRLFTYERFMW